MIAITHHGHDTYTDACLQSISANTPEGAAITVFDDGSFLPYEAPDWTDKLDDFQVVRHPGKLGVNGTWNQAVRFFLESGSEYLLVTNNDVLFTPGWYSTMRDAFLLKEVGIVGPFTNQPGHQPAQQFGHPCARPGNFFAQAAKGRKRMLYYVPYVNGFCFLLKRDRIVGNDPWFVSDDPNYCGEDAYQERMRAARLIAVIAEAHVYHFKDVTMESWKYGRMGMSLETLPARLEEKEQGRGTKGSPARTAT